MQATDDYAVFDLSDTLLLVWKTSMTRDGVLAAGKTLERMQKSRGGKVMFLTVIDDQVSIKAPPEARQELASMIKRNSNAISAAAIVFDAEGFKATAIRSVVTAVSLASRSPFKEKVFADVNAAAIWLTATTGQDRARAAALCQQVAKARLVRTASA